MKVILLHDVPGVGRKHEVRNVADGYARNFIIPNKLGEFATSTALKNAYRNLEAHKKKQQEGENALEKALVEINDKELRTEASANEKGNLFSGIGKKEIISILKENGLGTIPSQDILLDTPIKKIGVHPISLKAKDGAIQFTLFIERKR